MDMFKYIEQVIDFEMRNAVDALIVDGTKQCYLTRTFYNYIICKYDPWIVGSNIFLVNGEPSVFGFIKFLVSIFYIGKGKRTRMLDHLNDARKLFNTTKCISKPSHKDKVILREFRNDKGILIIPVYDSSNHFEALNRECVMIESRGLDNLCNKVRGSSYGLDSWNSYKRCNYGYMLLYGAYKRYISERLMPIKINELLTRKL